MYKQSDLFTNMDGKTALYNDLVSAYKLAKPGIKHSAADKYVKEYYNSIKKEPNALELGKSKVAEWKCCSLKRKSNLFSYWDNLNKHKQSSEANAKSASDATEEIEVDTPLLPQPNNAPSTSTKTHLNLHCCFLLRKTVIKKID